MVDFIMQNYVGWWSCLWFPLIFTAAFIFGLPFLDLGIISFSEEYKRKRIDKKIKIGRKHHVDGNQYYDLKVKYEQGRATIFKIEEELQKEKAHLSELKNELREVNLKHAELQEKGDALFKKYNTLSSRRSIDKDFRGRWVVQFKRAGETVRERVEIRDNQYIVISDNGDLQSFDIRLVDFDLEDKRFTFARTNYEKNDIRLVELNIIDNDRFEGYENNTGSVIYTRSTYKDIIRVESQLRDMSDLTEL